MAQASATRSSRSGPTDRPPLARSPDVVALLVLVGGVGAADRRVRKVLRALVTDRGVEQPRRQAAALDVAQHRAGRAGRGDGRLAAESREGERALCVDLADAGPVDLGALGEVAQP